MSELLKTVLPTKRHWICFKPDGVTPDCCGHGIPPRAGKVEVFDTREQMEAYAPAEVKQAREDATKNQAVEEVNSSFPIEPGVTRLNKAWEAFMFKFGGITDPAIVPVALPGLYAESERISKTYAETADIFWAKHLARTVEIETRRVTEKDHVRSLSAADLQARLSGE